MPVKEQSGLDVSIYFPSGQLIEVILQHICACVV